MFYSGVVYLFGFCFEKLVFKGESCLGISCFGSGDCGANLRHAAFGMAWFFQLLPLFCIILIEQTLLGLHQRSCVVGLRVKDGGHGCCFRSLRFWILVWKK